jgi:hypothetical protein
LASAVSVRRKWMGYNMCVRWAVDAEYLHLSIIPLLGAMSPGMSIPWQDLDFDESLQDEVTASDTSAGIRMWLPRELLRSEANRRAATPSAA